MKRRLALVETKEQIMKRIALATSFLTAMSLLVNGQTSKPPPDVDRKIEQEIRSFQRELFAANKRRDRAELERMIAEGFIFIHSTGNWESRQEYIENATAGALKAQSEGMEFERLDEDLRVYQGNTARLSYHVMIRNQGVESQGRHVDVFVKIAGRWQWVLAQSTRLAPRPSAAKIDTRIYNTYVGRYEIGGGRTFTVLREGDSLKSLTTGRAPGELIPKSETDFIWFNAEMNLPAVFEVTFIKDVNGSVTHAAFRRDGQELWRAPKKK